MYITFFKVPVTAIVLIFCDPHYNNNAYFCILFNISRICYNTLYHLILSKPNKLKTAQAVQLTWIMSPTTKIIAKQDTISA